MVKQNPNLRFTQDLIPLKLNKILYLVIHHIEAEYATIGNLHKWHLGFGWSGCGYNEYIRKDGKMIVGRGDNIGAHCANMNSKSYGIALEGNYEKETDMPEAQRKALIKRLKYHLNRLPNILEIVPHNRFVNTDCPGKHVNMEKIITEANSINKEHVENVAVLKRNLLIGSPGYWLENAQEGKMVRGEFAEALIANVANRIRGLYKWK